MTQRELQSRAEQVPFADFVQWHRSLPSRLETVSPFLSELMRFIASFRAKDGSELEIEMAAQKALANAIVHGNQMDPGKHVYVTCQCLADGEVRLMVRDEGEGFEPDGVADTSPPNNQRRISGRGIHLMKTFMDEVSFEGGGSVLRMRKNAQPRVRRTPGFRSAWKSLLWREIDRPRQSKFI
jgi:serine/threonine-protein kinase RsbW